MTTLSHFGMVVSFDVGDRLRTKAGQVGTIESIANRRPWKITLRLDDGEPIKIHQNDIEKFLT